METEFPRARLAHMTHASMSGALYTRLYETWPILVARPAEGMTTSVIACGTCGLPFRVVVLSARATRRRRLIWLGSAIGIPVVLVVGVRLIFTAPHAAGLPIWVVLPLIALMFAGFFGALFLLVKFFLEYGVRGIGISSPHSIRGPRRPGGPLAR